MAAYHERARTNFGGAQQIVGPEPREAPFASIVLRRSCSVTPWPGQLNRYRARVLRKLQGGSLWWLGWLRRLPARGKLFGRARLFMIRAIGGCQVSISARCLTRALRGGD